MAPLQEIRLGIDGCDGVVLFAQDVARIYVFPVIVPGALVAAVKLKGAVNYTNVDSAFDLGEIAFATYANQAEYSALYLALMCHNTLEVLAHPSYFTDPECASLPPPSVLAVGYPRCGLRELRGLAWARATCGMDGAFADSFGATLCGGLLDIHCPIGPLQLAPGAVAKFYPPDVGVLQLPEIVLKNLTDAGNKVVVRRHGDSALDGPDRGKPLHAASMRWYQSALDLALRHTTSELKDMNVFGQLPDIAGILPHTMRTQFNPTDGDSHLPLPIPHFVDADGRLPSATALVKKISDDSWSVCHTAIEWAEDPSNNTTHKNDAIVALACASAPVNRQNCSGELLVARVDLARTSATMVETTMKVDDVGQSTFTARKYVIDALATEMLAMRRSLRYVDKRLIIGPGMHCLDVLRNSGASNAHKLGFVHENGYVEVVLPMVFDAAGSDAADDDASGGWLDDVNGPSMVPRLYAGYLWVPLSIEYEKLSPPTAVKCIERYQRKGKNVQWSVGFEDDAGIEIGDDDVLIRTITHDSTKEGSRWVGRLHPFVVQSGIMTRGQHAAAGGAPAAQLFELPTDFPSDTDIDNAAIGTLRGWATTFITDAIQTDQRFKINFQNALHAQRLTYRAAEEHGRATIFLPFTTMFLFVKAHGSAWTSVEDASEPDTVYLAPPRAGYD